MPLFGKRERKISRILIVEDEPLVAFDNEHFLRDAGYDVVATVDTAAEAVDQIRTRRPDLILTDVNLSDGSTGMEVAEAARGTGVPVVFVTGACPEGARALALGCLAKPYSQRELLATIELVDAHLAGERPKRMPRGFTLFGG